MFTNRLAAHKKIHATLLVALSASIPVFFLVSNFLTGLLVLNWLLSGNFKKSLDKLRENRLYMATIGLFICFVLGLIHTTNLPEGLKDLEVKLSMFLIPLVVFASGAPSKKTLNRIFTVFAISAILVTTIALIIGINTFITTGNIDSLFYHQLANNVRLHAVYLSCYLVFSFFVIIQKINFQNTKPLKLLILLVLEAYIIGLLILLSSKTLLAVFMVALVIYTILAFRKSKKFLTGVLITLFLNLIVLTTLTLTPYTSQRFKQTISTNFDVLNQNQFNYDTEFSGLSLRLLFWKFAFMINQRENTELFGVGTGDSKDKLNEIYKEYNLYQGNAYNKGDTGYQNYNTHNQFVETYLKLGLAGALYLILFFITITYYSTKQKEILFTVWLIIFISFSLTETTLQTNKGIVYFAFFISIFLKSISVRNLKGLS